MTDSKLKPRYIGNFSAAPPWFSFTCACVHCNVSWTGCQDAADCPLCGRGAPEYDELLDRGAQRG